MSYLPPHPDRASQPSMPAEIDVAAVDRLMQSGEPLLLLDCRQPEENALVRLPGSTLIPMQEIPARIEELAPFRDRPVVVYCHHGVRSLRVAHWLRAQGFSQVQNMRGGIDAWALEIDPAMPRY